VRAVKYRDVIKLLESNGWYFQRMGRGDHMIYRHPTRPGSIVVAGGGKLNRDIPTGTLNSILRQAGLK
jgi:predicted RNA binding protein YcfA (HicA-like mRNA interferase family)